MLLGMIRKGMFIGDRYEIIDKIGTGGMSDVYKAKCHKLNRYVAIKILKQEFSEDKSFVTKFKQEAQAAAGLSHPNIVNVYDVGEENDIHYIVMELIEGITLKKYIERKGKLPVKEAVSIAIQVAQGIEAAHNNHIIHRDIKPQNIIISREGKVKVADFGIARAASANTINSNAMGSVHYISPEQARGGYIDERSDIYSLGITLFEMITGTVPYEGDSTVSIALQHIQSELPSAKQYVEELPISVEKIIEKCTQKKPDRRYLKVSSLIADLKRSLIEPDVDFVQLVPLTNTAATVMISDDEVSIIRQEAGTLKPDDDEIYSDTDEATEDEDIDEESELDDEASPKLDKFVYIGGIVAGIVIIIVGILIFTKATGCSGSTVENETTTISSQGETTISDKQTIVPNVVGKTEEEAFKILKDNTLGGYVEKTAYDNTVEKGLVISQSIAADEVVDKNKTINLVISLGPESHDIPNLVGKNKDDATKELEAMNLNLTIETTYENNSEVEIDKVISTSPTSPTQIKYGDKITLVISLGNDTSDVQVPSVVGKDQEAAKELFTEQGLSMKVLNEEYSSKYAKGKVINQDITSGTTAPRGTTVGVIVSKGEEETTAAPVVENKYTLSATLDTKNVFPEDSSMTTGVLIGVVRYKVGSRTIEEEITLDKKKWSATDYSYTQSYTIKGLDSAPSSAEFVITLITPDNKSKDCTISCTIK